jgi:hypothetical protein
MYKYASFQYRFPIEDTIVRYGKRAESAHNEYLQLAVELGVAGLVIFLVGIGVWTYEAKRLFIRTLSPWDRGVAVGCCAGVLAILAHAGVDSVFHEPALVLLLILLGGVVLAMRRQQDLAPGEWQFPIPYHPAKGIFITVAVAALALLIFRPAVAWFMVEQGNKTITDADNHTAIEWYQYASIVDPGSTSVRDGLARFYVQQFRLSSDPEWLRQAASELEIAMSINPLDGRAPYRLGTIYLLLADQRILAAHRDSLIAQAAQFLEKTITVDPFSPFGYFELGKLRRGQGDLMAARQLLERAISYEPNFIPARVALVDLAKETGQTEVAEFHLVAIREIRAKYQDWTLTPLEQQFLGISPPSS